MCYNKAKACSHVMMKDGITVMKRTILASGSPRRKELLEQIGMEFIVITSEADEHTDITDPEQYVIYLSGIKAEAVHNKIQESNIDDIVSDKEWQQDIKEGDYAGLCAFQGCYGMVAVTKRNGRYYVVMKEMPDVKHGTPKDIEEMERECIPVENTKIHLKIEANFQKMKDETVFYFDDGQGFKQIGIRKKLYFKLDHFSGCRFGLFVYATKETGGKASFTDFIYTGSSDKKRGKYE